MIITFIGHSSIYGADGLYDGIKRAIIDNLCNEENILFYCGGYGDFDNMCAKACRSIRKEHPRCEVIYITPYLSKLRHTDASIYDSTIYPPLENVPPKFAVLKRNEWMVNEADLIIVYVKFSHGGACKTLRYAQRKKKRIINLAEQDI